MLDQQRIKRERGFKVVVRRLPPEMTNEEFLNTFSPMPEQNYIAIQSPDKEWGIDARSVGWIHFVEEQDALWFIKKFTGYQVIDNKGIGYCVYCDMAPEPTVPRVVRSNRKRGTLMENQDYLEFLKKYEENPTFVDKISLNNGENITPEIMLKEIEGKTNKKYPESTPLLDFLMSRKVTRQISPEKPKVRSRDRGDRDRRSNDDKQTRRERKRDRKDKKLRSDRRDRDAERLEREAIAKGMTVTYSKSGKVTRWSANSNPVPKMPLKEKIDEAKNEPPNSQKTSEIKKKNVAFSQSQKEKSEPSGPVSTSELVPSKSEATDGAKRRGGPKIPFKEKKDGAKNEPPNSQKTSENKKKNVAFSQSQKEKSEPSGPVSTSELVPSKSEATDGAKRRRGPKMPLKEKKDGAKNEPPNSQKTSENKKKNVPFSQSEKEKSEPSGSVESVPSNLDPESNKRRRAKPDQQIYRPGSFRSGTGNGSRKAAAGDKTGNRDKTDKNPL